MIHFPYFNKWLLWTQKSFNQNECHRILNKVFFVFGPFFALCVIAINLKGQTYTIVNHTHTFPYLMEGSSIMESTKNVLGFHGWSKPTNWKSIFSIEPLLNIVVLKDSCFTWIQHYAHSHNIWTWHHLKILFLKQR